MDQLPPTTANPGVIRFFSAMASISLAEKAIIFARKQHRQERQFMAINPSGSVVCQSDQYRRLLRLRNWAAAGSGISQVRSRALDAEPAALSRKTGKPDRHRARRFRTEEGSSEQDGRQCPCRHSCRVLRTYRVLFRLSEIRPEVVPSAIRRSPVPKGARNLRLPSGRAAHFASLEKGSGRME